MFYEECVEAGPDLCTLFELSADKVQARVDALFERLKVRPIAVSTDAKGSTGLDYGLVDYALVRRLVFAFLYTPYAPLAPTPNFASALSYWLSEAEKGNGQPLWNAVKGTQEQFKCRCPTPLPSTNPGLDPTLAILCGDGDKVEDSIDEIEAHQSRMAQDSSFAELWPWRVICA